MQPKIGAHVSVAGGLYKAFENAKAIGAECIQIFGSTPRGWQTKMPSDETVMQFKSARKESNIGPVYLHGAYLVNLASANEALRQKSIKNLAEHLEISEMIGAEGLIFHVGSGKDSDHHEAVKKAVEAMREILSRVPGQAELVIENAAGGGAKIGRNAKEIGEIARELDSPRVKVCFDTAHAFEAGLIDEYSPEKIEKLFDEWDKAVGIKNIVALHVNDSKTTFDSHHDRHENIGEGYIGLRGFKNLAQEKRLHDKAWILEVPGFGGNGPDRKNVEILKTCFGARI